MIDYTKYLILIPARGGSKGIKNKNIIQCFGRPLIDYTILSAKIADKTKVIVSSDSQKILDKAAIFKDIIIDRRPDNLSTDETKSEDVIDYLIQQYQENHHTAFILLQPTSPCRTRKQVLDAIELFEKSENKDCLISVKKESNKFLKGFYEVSGCAQPISKEEFLFERRQDLPDIYLTNGAIYITTINHFRKAKKLYSKDKTILFHMNDETSVDIDSLEDLSEAEKVIKNRGE